MFDTVISNGIIISPHDRYIPKHGSIGIKNGTIQYTGDKLLTKSDAKDFVDASGTIVMPGLVNGHCHGDMGFAKGLGDNTTLGEQMNIFRDNNWFFNDLTEEDRYFSRLLTYTEALLSGTTMLVENMFWSLGDLSYKAFNTIGLRGVPVEDIRYDFYNSDGFVTSDMLDKFAKKCKTKDLIPALGIMPEEEFTSERLKKTASITNNNGIYYTSHLAETTWRYEASQTNMNGTPVEVLNEYGLINEHYIGSHGVYLNKNDINILSKQKAKIVNTPLCEMKISDGIAPIPSLINAGVNVALGTDGAMWNNSNDIFREMKGMALLHSLNSGVRSLDAKCILDMAIINGVKLFGLEEKLGTLEEGKIADIILVDATKPHMWPLRTNDKENVTSNLVYCATGSDVSDVFVNGNHLVKNGIAAHIDIKKIKKYTLEASLKAARSFQLIKSLQ